MRSRRTVTSLCQAVPPLRSAWNTALIAGVAATIVGFGAWPAAAASKKEIGFGAGAFGTEVQLGQLAVSGPSDAVGLGGGCTTRVGVGRKQSVAGVDLRPIFSTGTINTRVASKKTHTGVAATASASTEHISLLKGVIKATAIKSASTTNRNNSTGAFTTSAAGTKLVDLVIAGHHITATPKPNTRIGVPGIGYVILNQQTVTTQGGYRGLTVVAIHVVVTVLNKIAHIGTQAFVSVATSSLTSPVKGVLEGIAFGADVNVGGIITAGGIFPAGLGCLGTNGVPKTNSAASVNVPGVIKAGAVTDTANGIVNAHKIYGKETSSIAHLNLLKGLLTAKAIKAAVSVKGKPAKLRDTSSFVGLKLNGKRLLNVNIKPNTKIKLGIGTLWLHRQIKTGNSITVVMVQLIIGKHHKSTGLPAGAEINIGYASVGVQ